MMTSLTFLIKTLKHQNRQEQVAWSLTFLILGSALYRAIVSHPFWIDAYLLYLPGIVFVPLVLIITLLSGRSKLNLVRVIATFAVTLIWLFPLRVSGNSTRDDQNGKYRLVSLNIQSQATEVSGAISKIQKLKPDFICFQEIWHRPELELVNQLLPEFQVLGAASDKYERRNFNEGTFLAVRKDWSIKESSLKEESAIALVSRDDIDLLVVSIHAPRAQSFFPPGLKQTVREQIDKSEELRDELAPYEQPIVIAGDFNAPESGPASKILGPRFHSAFHQAGIGFGLTFPSNLPLARIDHALGTKEIVFSTYTTHDFGSDHLGLIVDFEVDRL